MTLGRPENAPSTAHLRPAIMLKVKIRRNVAKSAFNIRDFILIRNEHVLLLFILFILLQGSNVNSRKFRGKFS